MKIVLIGPVYPYKGGISHYTSLLYTALSIKHEVCMISYKMQYPGLLYKKEQKDYNNRSFQIKDTHYWIHTANPVNIFTVARKIKGMKPDAVVIQWWHPYFAPCYYLLCKLLRNVPTLFVCHNVFPHERFLLDRMLCRIALGQGHKFIVQSLQDKEDLLQIKPDAQYVVTPHPTYNVFKMKNMSKQEARGILEIHADAPVLLFFGFVREYKGLQYLLDALKAVREQIKDIQLWVVGDFGEDKAAYMEQIVRNGVENSITVVEGYIPDCEVEKYFAACDLVVLPYISATQSGIVQIAYGFEKPVVVTDVGGLPEVVIDGKTGYIVPSKDTEAIAEAIIKFFGKDRLTDWQHNIREKAADFSWEAMTERIEGLLG